MQAVRPRWDFVENAMGYLGKAFLAPPNLEQLLWNMVVIECLLSEKPDGTNAKSMRQRLKIIHEGTEDERTKVQDEFEDVNYFRCELVHSNRFDEKVQFRHLAQARNLARRVMSWFVDYLLSVHATFQRKGYEGYPSREFLLGSIDKIIRKNAINDFNQEIRRLLASSPES